MRSLAVAALCVIGGMSSTVASAQMAPPNNLGVRLGHIHLNVQDVEAQQRFWTSNLDDFVKRLDAQGVKLDAPPRQLPNSRTRVAFLTDPWGTYIEVTENLAPASM